MPSRGVPRERKEGQLLVAPSQLGRRRLKQQRSKTPPLAVDGGWHVARSHDHEVGPLGVAHATEPPRAFSTRCGQPGGMKTQSPAFAAKV